MKIFRNTVTAISTFALLFLFATAARATDIQINPTGPSFTLPTLFWGSNSTFGLGFNNNFWFSPLSNNESVCVYVSNTGNGGTHLFSATIVVNSNPQNTTPSDTTWTTVSFIGSTFAQQQPYPAVGLGGYVSGAALVSINLSNSSGGSPTDTASVRIVQTNGGCNSGQNLSSGGYTPVNAVSPLQSYSDGLGQAFTASSSTTNPAANVALLNFTVINVSRTSYFVKAVITSTVQVNVTLSNTTAPGTTCTNQTIGNLKGAASVSVATAQTACTSQPTATGSPTIFLIPANTTQIIDLTGYIVQPLFAANQGLEFTSAAVTGTVTVALYWYEK